MTVHASGTRQDEPPAFLDDFHLKRLPRKAGESLCGFPPSVFLRHKTPRALFPMACRRSVSTKKRRLLLISKNDSIESKPSKEKKSKKKKPTLNRKYVTFSESIIHNGNLHKVNSTKSGIYTSMMHKIIEQLEICEDSWKRVLVIRFDLHQKYHTKNNKLVSNFIDNLKRRLQRQYGIIEIGYVWSREHEKAKAQHYHCALFLDGNKVRHSSKLLLIIQDTWQNIKTGNTSPVKFIRNPYYFIDNEQTKADAIYRISYIAKARGKGYRDNQVKDNSTSRLQTKVLMK